MEETPSLPVPPVFKWQRVLFILVMIGVGVVIGRYVVPGDNIFSTPPVQFTAEKDGERQLVFPTFWEAWDTLHEKYIDSGKLGEQELFYGAVAGMVRAAGDPYTVFADPEETKQFEENIEGSFSGIGVEIGVRGGLITVIAPLKDSPAEQAGIREGDIVVAIDDQPLTQEDSIDQVVSRIRGKAGTQVILTVVHKDSKETEKVEITRATIEIESVKLTQEGDIAVVAITNFNGDTTERFNTIARQVATTTTRGIILDLRNNPGGYLQSAVDIASRFIPKGEVVVAERGKTDTEYHASGNALLGEIPVVVLINGGSASASEILAGALNDVLETPLIGEKTFGKGSVQEFIKLKDGSSMRVTVAKWYTPKGRNITEEGIAPTHEAKEDQATDADEQLERARQVLNERLGQ